MTEPASHHQPHPQTTVPTALQPMQHTWPALPQPISYMDTQILHLLNSNKPVAEIANIFHIDADECQYRVHSLFQKLEAFTPEDAIKKAKELTLL